MSSQTDIPTKINTMSSQREQTWNFTKADEFYGPRPGFVFKKGNKGLGYYPDIYNPHSENPTVNELIPIYRTRDTTPALIQCLSQSRWLDMISSKSRENPFSEGWTNPIFTKWVGHQSRRGSKLSKLTESEYKNVNNRR